MVDAMWWVLYMGAQFGSGCVYTCVRVPGCFQRNMFLAGGSVYRIRHGREVRCARGREYSRLLMRVEVLHEFVALVDDVDELVEQQLLAPLLLLRLLPV